MTKIVIVAGSPGSGKTTLLKMLPPSFKIVNVGDIMMEHAIKNNYTKDRDKIRYMKKGKIDLLRTLAFKDIKKMNGNIVIDTHMSVEQNGMFLSGLPLSNMLLLGKAVKGFVYVDAPTGVLIERRKKDKSRNREIEPSTIIDMQRIFNLASMAKYSSDLNIPMYIIVNEDGHLDEKVAKLKAFLSEVFD
ncbi:MAG: AAA family ATPase [Candidatus Micrarchaeia archaeon]